MATALVLAAAVHAAGWTPPTAVRGNTAAQRNTLLLVDQAAPFRVTMRPDAAGALGVEVDANDRGAAVITSIVRGSHVSELLEVGDALQPGCTRAPSAQATTVHRLRLRWQRACQPAMAQGCTAGTHVRHARLLPATLRYLPPPLQVVVQVNGCDTPTLGAVVDVVSAQASVLAIGTS
jgi:hypothetical protein